MKDPERRISPYLQHKYRREGVETLRLRVKDVRRDERLGLRRGSRLSLLHPNGIWCRHGLLAILQKCLPRPVGGGRVGVAFVRGRDRSWKVFKSVVKRIRMLSKPKLDLTRVFPGHATIAGGEH